MSEEKNPFEESIKKALEDGTLESPGRDWLRPFFEGRPWHDLAPRRFVIAVDPAYAGSDWYAKTESARWEDDVPKVRKAELRHTTISYAKPLPTTPEIEAIREALHKAIARRYGWHWEDITLDSATVRKIEPDEPDYPWQRLSVETLIEWGERLQKGGLLDDPEKRWVYQVAVMGQVVAVVRQFAVTVRDKVYQVLHIEMPE